MFVYSAKQTFVFFFCQILERHDSFLASIGIVLLLSKNRLYECIINAFIKGQNGLLR